MIEGTSACFCDPIKRSFAAHHFRMNSMLNAGNISAIGTKLHYKEVPREDKKKDSFLQNVELQRSLSLVSPGGFLFRLNKDLHRDERVQSHRQGNVKRDKRRIHDKTDKREFFTSVVDCGKRDVASIIQNSILQRRNLSLKSASKLKELRVEGANKFPLKAEDDLRNERLDDFSIDFKTRKEGATLFPQLPRPTNKTLCTSSQQRRKAMSFRAYSAISVNNNHILLKKPELSDMKRFETCPKEKHRTVDTKNYASDVVQFESEEIISERTQKRRTINVVLPAISTDEEEN